MTNFNSPRLPETQQMAKIVEKVLSDLTHIQQSYGKRADAAYVCSLLKSTKDILVKFPNLSIAQFLNALHNSLAPEGRWLRCSAQYYQLAYDLVNHLAGQRPLQEQDVVSAVQQLEQASLTLLNSNPGGNIAAGKAIRESIVALAKALRAKQGAG
jgi:hypothetical protein